MLANYRCNEIKENALQSVEDEIQVFINESAIKIMDNFRRKCEEIQSKALKIYDETASNYLSHVYQDIRRNLILSLSQKLYICFANQAKKLIPISQRNMRSDLEKEIKNNDNFYAVAVSIKKKYLENLIEQLKIICVFSNWEISISEYEEMFDEIIDSQRKVSLEDKKTETIVIY
jgi:hypothetical protein